MIGRILALAIGVVGAVAASQAPEFAQQYRQRLGGAIDELRLVVQRFDRDAAASGVSRDAAIARLRSQPDPLTQRQGDGAQERTDRLRDLERQQADFNGAGPFARLLVLLREADPSLARATYLTFEPAVPTTPEGAATAGVGFLLGWSGFAFLGRVVRGVRPRPRVRHIRA